ncbi:MAG: hypothetical protein ACOCVF_01795 [bacterium]
MELTIVIPVHEFNKDVETMLPLAIKSVENQNNVSFLPKVIIVYSLLIEEKIQTLVKGIETKLSINFLSNEDKIDFQSQVNLAVKNVDTKYFSILEFDDEYSNTYIKNAIEYTTYYSDVDVLMPIIVETNTQNQALQLTNQSVWSRDFVGENGTMGFLNAKSLNQYTNFKISGAIIKTDEFIAAGGLKSNIKLTFNYEFLLRILDSGSKIMIIPKTVYKHLVNREGSLFDVYSKTMTLQERKFWFDIAKKEAHFFNDRVIDTSMLIK